MGRVVLYMFMTADGFIAGPQGEFDSYEPSSAEQEMANEFFRGADAIMFGRVCYQGFVRSLGRARPEVANDAAPGSGVRDVLSG